MGAELKGCDICSCKSALAVWCERKPDLPRQQRCATVPRCAREEQGDPEHLLRHGCKYITSFWSEGAALWLLAAPTPASSSCLFQDIYLFRAFFFIHLYSHWITLYFSASGG